MRMTKEKVITIGTSNQQ